MDALRIGLFGFGRTGKLVAREVLDDPSLDLAWVVRRTDATRGSSAARELGVEGERGPILSLHDFIANVDHAVDVVIDFSGAAGVHAYQQLAELGTRVVSAVSRYETSSLAVLRRMSDHTAVLHSPNITLGINFLMIAARAMRALVPEADIAILEEHFREKQDTSGTALRIAESLEIPAASKVYSIRAGGIVGRHEVIFGLPNQTVRLVHESINRAAFGRGAIFAAKWLRQQAHGLYTMEDAVREKMSQAFLSA